MVKENVRLSIIQRFDVFTDHFPDFSCLTIVCPSSRNQKAVLPKKGKAEIAQWKAEQEAKKEKGEVA